MDSSNIVLFIPSLTYGGAEQVAVILANNFSRRGINTKLVTATSGDDLSNQIDKSVDHISLDASRVLSSIPKFARYLRNTQPEVVLSFMTHTNVAAIISNELSNRPTRIVVSEHQTITTRNQGCKDNLLMLLASLLYPRSHRVISVSRGLATELQDEFGVSPHMIRVIPNPVPRPDKEDLQSASPHPWFENESSIIVAAGRHEPVKDFSTLLRAVSKLRKQDEDVKLILLGDGSKTSDLKQLAIDLGIDQAVDFPGYVENPYPYYSAADLFVLSSRWEGFGNVIVEAMMVGTPVVASDCPVGPAEILMDGKFGELVPVGDVDSLARGIQSSLDNPPSKEKIRNRAQDFEPNKITSQYLDLLLST